MLDVPQQNWSLYEAMCREADHRRLREMTISEGWALYQSMFELAADGVEDSHWLEESRWQEKIATRQRTVRVLAQVDRISRGSRAADNTVRPDQLAPS
jgi:hypothetical protein